MGGYIGVTGTSWRVLYWVLTAFAGACTVAVYFTLPETFAPILLAQIAKQKRKETGDERWFAAIEAQSVHWKTRVSNILARPFKILFSETILLLITAYLSVSGLTFHYIAFCLCLPANSLSMDVFTYFSRLSLLFMVPRLVLSHRFISVVSYI